MEMTVHDIKKIELKQIMTIDSTTYSRRIKITDAHDKVEVFILFAKKSKELRPIVEKGIYNVA